jgi:hypothetical protein
MNSYCELYEIDLFRINRYSKFPSNFSKVSIFSYILCWNFIYFEKFDGNLQYLSQYIYEQCLIKVIFFNDIVNKNYINTIEFFYLSLSFLILILQFLYIEKTKLL